MVPVPTFAASADPSWRYGVYLFPVPPLLVAVSDVALALFVRAVELESAGLRIVTFVGILLVGWLSYLFAAIVAVALTADVLALRDHPGWNSNPWLAAGLGVVHVAGTELAFPYLISVPAIGYYVYRRRQLIAGGDPDSGEGGNDGSDGSDGSGDSEPAESSSVPAVTE
ncbi:hypothetical protein [Natrinema salifodinae]|uniref:Uncharacterized protein n=1 Tax=Natrinema salifodinae TaxID=1202768 RepID=A0A1I0PAT2_9EURY|nr:hypothetical protein [Natrinema salifodinae]SEW11331.1 hypothetical protein SAMN05216285_2343 [Natrinema salifodinae]